MVSSLAFRALKTLLIFLLTIGSLKAQQGGYFLSHHTPDKNFHEVSFDIVQDQNGIIYVANRDGIIVFDGKSWDFLKSQSAIFSFSVGLNQSIYTGGRNGFGVLEKDKFFKLRHKTLSDSSHHNSDIFSLITHNNILYGISEETVHVFVLETNNSYSMTPKRGGYFNNIFLFEDKIYVSNSLSGVLEVSGQELKVPSKDLNSLFPQTVTTSSDGSTLYFEDELGSLHWLNRNKESVIPVEADDQSYLNDNQIQQMKMLNSELMAVSTLRGGVVFLNPETGKFLQVIDEQNGLPSDEVYAIDTDLKGNLWLSHNKGFTRISPSAPLRSFSEYPGLDGDLLTSVMHQGILYVGTTSGLYSLKTIREYKNESYYEAKEIVEEAQHAERPAPSPSPRKRRGLLGFLKKKKSEPAVDTLPSTTELIRRTLIEKRVRKRLHSVNYRYEKVEGINSRVSDLHSDENRLLSAGLDGLFSIRYTEVQRILSDPVRSFYFSDHYNTVFVGTMNNQIKIFDMGSDPKELYLFGDFSNYTTHIFESPEHKIWFCGTAKIIWLTLEGQEIDDTAEIVFDNPNFYDVFGGSESGEIHFFNAAGQYTLQGASVEKVGSAQKIVKGSNGQIWTQDSTTWSPFGMTKRAKQFDLLSVFKDPKHLDLEEDQLWLISNNSLLRLNPSAESKLSEAYGLLLRGVNTDSSNLRPSGKLVIDQDKSAIQFEFVQPEYTGIMNIQYQYNLEGLASSNWTKWSPDFSTISFPYLPEGDYILHVKAKDSFGVVSDAAPIKFKVVPPYWKRPWFYALEFTALGLLLVISLRIKRLGYRYRLGSRLLALLTLIIIIEFVQTIAENEFQTKSSALFDFTIQVLMAIIILPLEGLLRKYIFKEKNVQLLDFFRIKEKEKTNEN